jgi:hypothetical protein
MAETTAQGYVPVGDFEILKMIGTPEAAAVAAPYLFDFKTIRPQNRDIAGDSNVAEATYTLSEMKFPDAPKRDLTTNNSDDLIAWQKWAIAKGYVPKDSRVGAPEWLLEAERDYERAQVHVQPSIVEPTPSPTPSAATTAAPSPKPSQVASQGTVGLSTPEKASRWPLVALGLAAFGAICFFVFKRAR